MLIEKIYFDLDDTIADFSRGLIDTCNFRPIPKEQSAKQQDDAMWAAIRDADHFYLHLEECDPGMALFRKLWEAYGERVEILSAVPKAKRGILTAEPDKRNWVAEHIDTDIVVNIVYSAEEKKKRALGPGCVLIDDLERNVRSWRETGGTAVHFLKDDPDYTAREINELLACIGSG